MRCFALGVSFGRRVKLNNPLMGTETNYHGPTLYYHYRRQVKLNNPLMGTETFQPLTQQ